MSWFFFTTSADFLLSWKKRARMALRLANSTALCTCPNATIVCSTLLHMSASVAGSQPPASRACRSSLQTYVKGPSAVLSLVSIDRRPLSVSFAKPESLPCSKSHISLSTGRLVSRATKPGAGHCSPICSITSGRNTGSTKYLVTNCVSSSDNKSTSVRANGSNIDPSLNLESASEGYLRSSPTEAGL